jgi:serine/threonine-protein kinase
MTVPEKIGKYQVESILGKGAMGVVYKAYDPEIQQSVAIKTIQKELLNLEEKDCQARLERFKQEVIAGRRLKHPNIVAIYEYGRDEETCYIVMELVRGKQLKDYFSEGYQFTLGEIIAIMLQLLDALDYAHRHGVIHRDIKPGNIMLTEGEQIQVTDFGIAKLDDSSLTRTGMVLGTPSYMAPEQCLGQHVDARTDIFSAGVVLYQFLTGEKPFGGDSPLTTMHQVLNVNPANPSILNVHIPKALDGIVQKALAKRPDERFQSAREFAEALRAVYEGFKTVKHDVASVPPSAEQVSAKLEGTIEEGTLTLTAGGLDQSLSPVAEATPVTVFEPRRSLRWFGIAASIFLLGLAIAWVFFLYEPIPESLEKPDGQSADVSSEEPKLAKKESPDTDEIVQAKLNAVLTSFACARLETSIDDQNQIILQGHLKPEDLPRLEREIAALPGADHIISKVETLIWPYCEVMDILAPFQPGGGNKQAMDFGPKQHTTRYIQGDHLVLGLTAPSYDAYLYVDYYQTDGGVVHMLPATPEQNKRYPAGQNFTIGEPKKGEKQWQVQPPFGTELIVILASREPLFQAPRPEIETAQDYLLALREAIARSNKDWLAADHFYITTAASN